MQIDWPTGTRRGRVHDLTRSAPPAHFSTAVSLHSHTHYSNEGMACVPAYLDRIPLVAGLCRREMRKYFERHGSAADFSKGWWHPPVTPEALVESERAHILTTLGLPALVSITDHDAIDAPLALRPAHPSMPISVRMDGALRRGLLPRRRAQPRSGVRARSNSTACPRTP